MLKEFELGIMNGKAYLYWGETREGYLFDCGGENLNALKAFIESEGINLQGVYFTHGHYDHIGGLNKLKGLFPDLKVFSSKEEEPFFKNTSFNLATFIEPSSNFSYDGPLNFLDEGALVGPFKVIKTPGHTCGGICFYNEREKMLIVGDTLFKDSFGRTDFPTGDYNTLIESLKTLMKLPKETIVYSAHTDKTTIARERKNLSERGLI